MIQEISSNQIDKVERNELEELSFNIDPNNKANEIYVEGGETKSIDNDIDQQGLDQLRFYGQANPSFAQEFPNGFLNDKYQQVFLENDDNNDDESYELELSNSSDLYEQNNDENAQQQLPNKNYENGEKLPSKQKREIQFEFVQQNSFSNDCLLVQKQTNNNLNKSRKKVRKQNRYLPLISPSKSKKKKEQTTEKKENKQGRKVSTPKVTVIPPLNIQQQYRQIEKFSKCKQLSYIQTRLNHYEELRSLIMLKQKDKQMMRGKRPLQTRMKRRGRRSKNQMLLNEAQKMNLNPCLKKRDISIELLQELSKKIQTYQRYKNSRYKYGQKVTLAQIGQIYHLQIGQVNSLYNQWLLDPGFEQKMTRLKAEKSAKELSKSQRIKSVKPQKIQPKFNEQFTKITEIRYIFCQNYLKLKKKGVRIYYLEEFPKDLILGRSNKLQEKSQENSIDYSLLAVLGITGRASWKVMKWFASKFEQVKDIQQLFSNVKEDEDSLEPSTTTKNYVILDCSILKEKEKVRSIQSATNSKVIFLPQMSKQLNPLQLWFIDVKNKLKQTDKSLNSLNQVLQIFSGTDFHKYISDSQKYAIMAVQKQFF